MPEAKEMPRIPDGAIRNNCGLPVRITTKGKSTVPVSRESIENADLENAPLSISQDRFIFELITTPQCYNRAWKAYQKAFPGANEHAAQVGAARLLNDPRILKRAEQYFALIGLDDVNSQIKHAKLLHESEDKIALGALKLLYDLKGKIVAKTESTHLHLNLASLLKQAKEEKAESGAVIDAEVEIEEENQA